MVTHSDRGAWLATVHGVAKESDIPYQLNNKNLILNFLWTIFLFGIGKTDR